MRLEDYDAVYYPGGHGPMEDLSVDPDSGALLREALASGNPLGIVCHAPAALLATRDANGNTPFANYRVTGFCNEEEAGVGFADKAKWLLEDELKKLPTQYSRGPPGNRTQSWTATSSRGRTPPLRALSPRSSSRLCPDQGRPCDPDNLQLEFLAAPGYPPDVREAHTSRPPECSARTSTIGR